MLLHSYQVTLVVTSSTYFLHLLYSLLFFLLKKKKKKTLTLPISPHLVLHFFQSFTSFFASISSHYSLLYHYSIIFFFLYFDSSSPYFILNKFNITSHIQSIFFQQKNCEYYLSLTHNEFLFFLITLIKGDFFFFF